MESLSLSELSSGEKKQYFSNKSNPSLPTTPRNQGITSDPKITWAPPRKPLKRKPQKG